MACGPESLAAAVRDRVVRISAVTRAVRAKAAAAMAATQVDTVLCAALFDRTFPDGLQSRIASGCGRRSRGPDPCGRPCGPSEGGGSDGSNAGKIQEPAQHKHSTHKQRCHERRRRKVARVRAEPHLLPQTASGPETVAVQSECPRPVLQFQVASIRAP
eukprot:4331690-Alexandrium_andersonii.AAC.1